MTDRGGVGGSAAGGGFDYQARVAAFFAVQILRDRNRQAPIDLPPDVVIESLRCETDGKVDDLNLPLSNEGMIYVQAKRSVDAGQGFQDALDQFIRAFLEGRGITNVGCRGPRSRKPENNLFALVGRSISRPLRETLPRVLERIRGDGTLPIDRAAYDAEKDVFDDTLRKVNGVWETQTGRPPSNEELRSFLSSLWIVVLDPEARSTEERLAATHLGNEIAEESRQAQAAWEVLVSKCHDLIGDRGCADRHAIRRHLVHAGIALKPAKPVAEDIERLRKYSRTTGLYLEEHAAIRWGGSTLKISRPVTTVLTERAERESFLVVGEPGAGKSGVLFALFEELERRGRDVVLIAAENVTVNAAARLGEDLGRLDHDVVQVLAEWDGSEKGIVIIDALDAARWEGAVRALRGFISAVLRRCPRWSVVASIREYDLEHSPDLRALFEGTPPVPGFVDPRFRHTVHVCIPALSDEEIGSVRDQSAELGALIDGSPPDLRGLLRLPFNLHLAAELLASGVDAGTLSPVRTQVELMNRYWECRVTGDAGRRVEREDLLRRACAGMVERRSLRLDRTALLQGGRSGAALDGLLSDKALVEWRPSSEAPPNDRFIKYPHHILFDYAVARLLLPAEPVDLARCLAGDPDLAFIVRPSLALFFQRAWDRDPPKKYFWDAALEVIATGDIPAFGKLVGPAVAAIRFRAVSEMDPLLERYRGADDRMREAADRALAYLFQAGRAEAATREDFFFAPAARPWYDLVERITE